MSEVPKHMRNIALLCLPYGGPYCLSFGFVGHWDVIRSEDLRETTFMMWYRTKVVFVQEK